MIKTFLLCFLTVAYAPLLAQQAFTVKGVLTDTTSNLFLENGTATLLHAKDSTLVNFSRAKKDGSFSINNLRPGNYILTATYPKYTDFVEKLTLDSTNTTVDLGNINMLLVSQLLKDVVITGTNAIVIKGDTIEYDASKYTIQPNSKVEDLLMQLPGIQVDKDGKITAQGETVQKVLVDGEEFFGDDPTLVTKNIRGDMVDKVQLYDKKSDQATFTGIDDGEKTKTINIQLKEDSKNGMFGKVDAGIGTEEFYQGQAMYNRFKGLQKFAAYGTVGNTGKIGLSWRDSDRYASSNNIEITGDGIMITSGSSDEFDRETYNGQGIPLAHSGGVHYDSKWNDKKESVNANYKIGSLDVTGNSNTISQNNLPSGIIQSGSNQDFNNFVFRQKLDVMYEIKFDTTSTLKVTVDGTIRNNRSDDDHQSESLNGENQLLNQSNRQNNNEGESKNFNSSLLWNKRLNKTGRTVSIGLNQASNRNNNEGLLYSQTDYYGNNETLDSTRLIDQQKLNNTNSNTINSNIAYTEPLSKNVTLAFNYRFNLSNRTSDLRSYNRSPNGDYSDIDSLYTNDFKLDQLTNLLGTTLNYKKDKNQLAVTFGAADVRFKQIDRFNNDRMERKFVNYSPSARFTRKFSAQKSLQLNYYGGTNQPSLNQIQPVRGNLDPLNISVGNPDLDPEFRHNLRTNYNSYKVLSGEYIHLSLNGNFTSNAIISNVSTDSVGQSIFRYENLADHKPLNLSAYVYYGSKIKSIDLQIGGNVNGSTNSSYNIINDELNKTQSNSLNVNLDVSKYAQKKYSISLSGGPSYSANVSSLQKQLSDEGWGFNGRAYFNVFLPAKFEVFSDANYTYTEATEAFADDFERLIWNGGFRKKFLKKEELILSITANDILNQNVGFRRNAYNNVITQSNYTTIKRYFMFSLVWEFNKMGANP